MAKMNPEELIRFKKIIDSRSTEELEDMETAIHNIISSRKEKETKFSVRMRKRL